jgi:hypothetical protein
MSETIQSGLTCQALKLFDRNTPIIFASGALDPINTQVFDRFGGYCHLGFNLALFATKNDIFSHAYL